MIFIKQRQAMVAVLLASLFSAPSALAEKLEDMLPGFLQEHEQLQASRANTNKSRQAWTQSKADLRPSLDMTLSQGYEKQLKPTGSDTKTGRNVEQLDLSQLIYDWGETPSKVRSAELRYYKAILQERLTEQGLILRAAQSYLNLLRSVEALRYSQRSEANIKKQTGLEEARVKRGSGLSTDVLQTKSSLAGAMATRVRNEGAVVSASNRFRSTFRRAIALDSLEIPRVPFEKIPGTLDDAIAVAKQNSLNLKQAQLDVAIAALAVRQASAKIGPKLEFKASAKHKHNDAGTLGTKEEYLAKIDLKMPLYAGGKNIAGYRSAKEALAAAEYTYADTEYSIEERVRNAWQNLSTSRSNAQFLRNQANISGEFLDFARKERKLGTRSLLDVLNGETAYINSLSSAVSAETDMAIAVFTLLQAMGELTPDVFEMKVIPELDPEEAVILPVIAPTPEATSAAAAARKIASKLEVQRDANFPGAVLEKEDDELLTEERSAADAKTEAPLSELIEPPSASISRPDVAPAWSEETSANQIKTDLQPSKNIQPVDPVPSFSDMSESATSTVADTTSRAAKQVAKQASKTVKSANSSESSQSVRQSETVSTPMEPMLTSEEAFSRPASVSEPGAVLEEMLVELDSSPEADSVQKIFEHFLEESDRLEMEAASISDFSAQVSVEAKG